MYSGEKTVFASNSFELPSMINGVDIYNSKFLYNLDRNLSSLDTYSKSEIHTRLDVMCSMNLLEYSDAIHYANKFIKWSDLPVNKDIRVVSSDQIRKYNS